MKLYPHLSFSGECEAAFQFYAQCFGGEIITMLAYGNSPMAEQAPPEWRGKILHATLSFGDNVLAGSDSIPGQYERPKGFQVLLGVDDPADAERIFNALAENGTVLMPIQQTFWARRFGVLVDRFGIPWEINCEQG
jgi:PhnB protein